MKTKTTKEAIFFAASKSPYIKLPKNDEFSMEDFLQENELIVDPQIWTDEIWNEHFLDKNGRIIFAANHDGLVTVLHYDNDGNVICMLDNDSYAANFEYQNGLLIHSVDSSERDIPKNIEYWFEYVYTAENDYKLSYVKNTVGYQEWREYNEIGKVSYYKIQENDIIQQERWFDYDIQGILSKSRDVDGNVIHYPTETGLYDYKVIH